MGDIPRLTQLPSTQDSPRVRLQPFATGAMAGGTQAAQLGALGGSMMGVGEALGKIGDRLLAEKEEADVQGAIAEYREEMREKLYGQNGILTRQGDNAAGATIEAQTEADKLRSDYAKRFGTKRAAQAWDRFSNQDVDSIVSRTAQHEAIQTRKATIEKGQAKIQSTIQSLIDARDDPSEVARKEEEIRRDAAYLFGRVQGLPKEVVDAETKRIISSAHAAVIDSYLKANERTYANEYFKEHKAALEPEYVMSREAALKQGARNDLLLARALEIAKSPVPDIEKAEAVDREFKDADEHAYVMQQMMATDSYLDRKRKEAEDAQVEAILLDAEEQWKNGNVEHDVSSLLPRKYRTTAERLKWQILTHGSVNTDEGTFRTLQTIYQQSYEDFKLIDLDTYADRLSGDVRAYFKTLQNNPTAGQWKGTINNKIVKRWNDMIRVDGSLTDEDWKIMRGEIMAQIDAANNGQGVMPGDTEAVDEIIKTWTQRGYRKDAGLFGKDIKAYRFRASEDEFYVPEAPMPAPERPATGAKSEEVRSEAGLPPGVGFEPPWAQKPYAEQYPGMARIAGVPPKPSGPVRPPAVPPDAVYSPELQQWQLIRNDKTVMAWERNGMPILTWPK